jgi:hypothetical protein
MIDRLWKLDSSAAQRNMQPTAKTAGRRANAPGPDTRRNP